MQREHIRRGFTISHQKVALDIDFTGCLRGYTELTIQPTHKDLRVINLHCRQCDIESVSVASYPADFVHHDPVVNMNVSDPADFHAYPEVKRKYYSALAESAEGELAIAIPSEVPIKPSGGTVAGQVASDAATPEPMTPGNRPSTPSVLEFASIHVVIEYTVRQPVDGVQFVLQTETHPQRIPHMYTMPHGARCWVPCVDSLWEKCTWDFEFVVPKVLYQETDDVSGVDDEESSSDPVVVVCSGDFLEQVAHPHISSKTIFLFSQSVATSVQQVAFAAGPFHVFQLPAAEEDSASQTPMHVFCPVGYEALLACSASFLRMAMNFYSTEFGSYPFGSYKVVFVEEFPSQRFDTATLSLANVDLLHGEDVVDQVFETRHTLSHGLASQWVGINIYQKTWSDLWLINGLGLYITGLFLRKLMGNNDYRFKLKKDMERVAEKDVGTMPPICQPGVFESPDAAVLPFINLKAPLVLHILDRRLAKSGTSLGLSRILPKIFLSAISGELQNNALSTHTFLRMCRKVSGFDPRSFAEQWIYGSGCPRFGFTAQFNRKKMVVEITMRQESPAHRASEKDPIKLALLKPVQVFEGPMTVRIHEADGTPYEHVLDIRSSFKRYEVPFNTKYKRIRRNTKRFIARQQAAIAAAQGDTEAKEAIGMIDMGFGLDVWEQEAERENWKVADWTEEDEQVMAGATYEWIRMDADFEWISFLHFDQPDFMWVSQLTRDRDVVAQLEAVYALSRQPSAIVSSTLTKTVLVTNYYYRIRVEAALALVACATPRLDFLGLFHLFKIFSRYCYDPFEKTQDLFMRTYVPRPNDFSDFSEYFVRKAVITAISQVRLNNGKSPPIVRQLLIDQLRHNDNTTNGFSDALYVCTVISALACACVSTVPPERGEFLPTESRSDQNEEDQELLKTAQAEVVRYRTMDRLVPSPHNVVTVAALEWNLILTLAGLIPPDSKLYASFTREGNETQVRIAAFDGLMLINDWYSPRVINYLLTVVSQDSSRIVRQHVARCMTESLAILFHVGDIKHPSKDDPLLIEEDGNVADSVKELRKNEADALVKALRKNKDIGRNDTLRQMIMPIILSNETDHETRLCLIKLAELAFKGAEESPPKVTIHIPRAPAPEAPSITPALKKRLKFSVPAPVKVNTPATSVQPKRIRLQALPQAEVAPSPTPSQRSTSARPPPPPPPLATQPKVDLPKKGVAFAAKTKAKSKASPAKKPKPLHPAQANGMSMDDYRASRSALKKMLVNKHARIFAQPVDPVRDSAPNYFAIIKTPMDLSTIHAKLEGGLYSDRFAFEADFKLMINNAKTYNAAGSWAHGEALELVNFFNKQWERINKTLEVAHRAPPPPPAPSSNASTRRQVSARASTRQSEVPSQPTNEEDIDAMILQEISETPPPVPPTISPQPSRPTIKLRVNGAANGLASTSASSSVPKPPKALKPKVVPPAPPALKPPVLKRLTDDDDAGKELLEEVLAIEEERKLEKRMAKTNTPKKDRDKVGESSHRKEKEKESDREKTKDKDVSATVSTQSSAHPKLIVKKPANGHNTPTVPAKGKGKDKDKDKDKEVARPTAGSSRQQSQNEAGTSINEKRCKEILKKLIALPQALLFRQPVDAELLGCPTYYDEIKEPMDFQTMTKKLDKHQYATMEQFAKDMFLVFNNCRQFNPQGTEPVQHAEVLEKAFRKEWTKITEKKSMEKKIEEKKIEEKKIDPNDKKMLQSILAKLRGEECAYFFLEAVDPIKLQIPHYFEVIPRKDARDLKLIREKLDADKYDCTAALEADIDLMVKNAITFNGSESFVGVAAIALSERFKELLKGKGVTTKKRKEKDVTANGTAAGGETPHKRARLM